MTPTAALLPAPPPHLLGIPARTAPPRPAPLTGSPVLAHRWRTELAGRCGRFLVDDATRCPDVSGARTLADLPLGHLRAAPRPPEVELPARAAQGLVDRLRRSADAAARCLAERAGAAPLRAGGPAAALHHLLTRHRFLKGSRGFVDPARQQRVVSSFTAAGAPVPLVISGFPFKQRDNGLKVAGRRPDLAELGALVRLRELAEAVRQVYPPGVRFEVLSDGGYYRERDRTDTATYADGLRSFAALVGLSDVLVLRDRAAAVAESLRPADAAARAGSVDRWDDWIRDIADGPLAAGDPHGVGDALRRRPSLDLPPGTTFDAIFRSMVFSVPVPRPGRGSSCPAWSQLVLSDLFEVRAATPELAAARRVVIARAMADAVRYVATVLADREHLVDERFPPHVRLATVVSRPDCYGFSYLGGSSVLPWHGTGCLDARGRVGTDFLAALVHRGFVPVRSELVGADQPLMMVPGAAVTARGTVDETYLAGVRLRSR